MAQLLKTKPGSSTVLPVFLAGKYQTQTISVDSSSSSTTQSPPPKPLLIVTPSGKGTYPVILFFHGFMLRNIFYTDLLNHISSHGFILVAPQLYRVPPKGIREVESAAQVANWLQSGLQSVLPENIEPNLKTVVLSGHSRGGKTAFALALGYGDPIQKFSTLIGIDPVGNNFGTTTPHILTYEPKSFDIPFPIAVIGTGLGPESKGLMSCPCAPKKYNHEEFFNESNPPRAHFTAKNYGHMDMLNDDLSGLMGKMADSMCVNGKGPRDPLRRCIGGIVIAFLNYYFQDNEVDFNTIVNEPDVAPVVLDQVQFDAS
ncbi:hypothetical protein ES288_A08G219200v1 [Gossypium darwinii]|uniref:Uncharacterized protein n=1 Tax=Gossypium darwinii TaxID=34276 RepID=A0A5D2FPP2_GOSDA|nr:hypothetical protein ES288_A08G219200v1 [Gossypium darwinii]